MQHVKEPAVKVDPEAIDAMGQLSVKLVAAQRALGKAIRNHGLVVDRAYENHADLVDACVECKTALADFLDKHTTFNPTIHALSRLTVDVDPHDPADDAVRTYLARRGKR